MYSEQHSCIFVHIPKCAGTSIEKKLGFIEELGRRVQDHRTIRHIEPLSVAHAAQLTDPLDRRAIALYLRNRCLPGGRAVPSARQYRDAFKFTFVRNPWSRAYSWYRNVIRSEIHRKNFGVSPEASFGDFLEHHKDNWALRPQLFWLRDRSGALPMDFVGRFERLNDDWAHVAEELGIDDPSLPHLVEGSSPNTSTGSGQTPLPSSYVEAFDSRTRALVAERYADEIRLFGYEFDDGYSTSH